MSPSPATQAVRSFMNAASFGSSPSGTGAPAGAGEAETMPMSSAYIGKYVFASTANCA